MTYKLDTSAEDDTSGRLRSGSLFSGYGGLDFAVEEVFDAETVWFSEINPAVARVFAHHWPGIPNLGDITSIDWSTVVPVDIVAGGFPCQDVSTAGNGAGLAPGTRTGLWTHMAAAVSALQPTYVVAENVRGLLSAPATRPGAQGDDCAHCNPTSRADDAVRDLEPDTRAVGDRARQPVLRALGAVLGDLADLGYDTQWCGLPATTIGAAHPRYRIFMLAHRRGVPHPARLRSRPGRRDTGTRQSSPRNDRSQPPSHRPRPQPTNERPERGGVEAVAPDRDAVRRWGRYAHAITRWEHLTGRPAPTPVQLGGDGRPRPAPVFVEWLMGLEPGWVTNPALGLTATEQLAALGNGVLPAQAAEALRHLVTLTTA